MAATVALSPRVTPNSIDTSPLTVMLSVPLSVPPDVPLLFIAARRTCRTSRC